MMIRVMGLETCDRCKKLKDALKSAKIAFEFSDCDNDPENCDALEALTDTKHYPMVLMYGIDQNLLEVVFITDDSKILNTGTIINNGVRLIPNHSIDGLLRYTINRLNLKL